MLNPPLTKEDAEKYRYGVWAGLPKGHRWCPEYCAYEVWSRDSWRSMQCSRKAKHGPAQLYCKQHAQRVCKQLGIIMEESSCATSTHGATP